MKKILLGFVAFSIFNINAQNFEEDVPNFCGKACYFLDKPGRLQGFGANKSVVPNNYDVIHQTLAFETDPGVKYIEGSVETTLIPLSNIDEIYFDCATSLVVDSVIFNGAHAVFVQNPGDELIISLPLILNAGTEYKIKVYYHGIPDDSGFGSFSNETHNGVPVAWTLSEPYGAKDWWPCKQSLADKIDSIDIIITTPIAYRAGSNGLLVNETTTIAKRTVHWKHKFPIPAYLVAFAATNYAIYEDKTPVGLTDTIVTLNYVYPEDLAQIKNQTNAIHAMFDVFNELGGVYPYISEKYGHMQFNWGGGMEHTTMSSMGGFGLELLSHELAHQWFGDMITCASWEEIWLNEGFASYWTGLIYERVVTPWWMTWKSTRRNLVLSQPGGSVKVNDTTSEARIFDNRLTYAKGAYILHQLRWVIGDQAFFDAVYNYSQDPALRFSYATTADLIAHFEATSGKDLAYYFQDWYEGEGYPIYDIVWTQDADNNVGFTVHQTASVPSAGFFELPIPIKLSNGTQDTILVLNNTSNGQYFNMPIDFAASQLTFDPELWTLGKLNSAVLTLNENSTIAVNVYPNPSSDVVFVQFPQIVQIEKVELIDNAGRKVWSNSQQETNLIAIPVEGLASGLYIVQIKVQGNHQIIKQKVAIR